MDKLVLRQLERNLTNCRLSFNSLEHTLKEIIKTYCEDYQVDKINIESLNFIYESPFGNEKIQISYVSINEDRVYLSTKNDESLYFFEMPFYMQSELIDKLLYFLK